MRDHYFREDENELPYLVSQKRDYEKSSECYDENDYDEVSPNPTNAEKLDSILDSMGLFLAQKVILKNALVSLLDSRDCTRLDVNNEEYGYYTFVFTRENEYIKTTDTFEYSTEFEFRRTFLDCYTSHNYDRLISNPRFRALLEKTDGEFLRFSGGYETDFSFADDEFSFRDEINVSVIFKVGSAQRSYDLDLERMELSDKYYEF